MMGICARISLVLLGLACVAHAQVSGGASSTARFAECQVDLVEKEQAAGCVSVIMYQTLPTSGGSVESDCGKLAAFARGSGARGIRTSVSRSPNIDGYAASCAILTLGSSCTNFLQALGQGALLTPCKAQFQTYVEGLITSGSLNGTVVRGFAPAPAETQAPYTSTVLNIVEAPSGLSLAPGPIPQYIRAQDTAGRR